MSINKENISEYLKTTQETPAEMLGHLRSLLQASNKYHGSFTDNPRYAPYLEQAQKRGLLPQATLDIINQQKLVGPVSKDFLEPTYQSKIRQRF